MLQNPPLASMLPFHHAMQVAAAQAQAAQAQAEVFTTQSAVTSISSSSVTSAVTSSPGITSVPTPPMPNGSGPPPTGPHHHHHPPMPPHPFHPSGLPPGHPHFHHSLGLEPPRPRFLFKMPRVVPNQKEKFETDDLMKRHSREGEVRYTAYRDRPLHERQTKFICALREGHTEIAFIATGFNMILTFDPTPAFNPAHRQCDYEKEPGKVHIRSPFILNGVCVRWKGYLDLERLDGVGCLEFDEDTATLEDAIMRDTVEAYNRRIKDLEEHSKARQRQFAAFMGHQQQVAAALQAQISTGSTGASTNQQPPMVTSPTNNNLISSSTTTTSANLVNNSHLGVSSHHSSSDPEPSPRKKPMLDLSSAPSSTATSVTT